MLLPGSQPPASVCVVGGGVGGIVLCCVVLEAGEGLLEVGCEWPSGWWAVPCVSGTKAVSGPHGCGRGLGVPAGRAAGWR